jgi:2-polyprenyl-3-methyl-5-hydroxy-6-metoxy-1,4-benzoquinol methylase
VTKQSLQLGFSSTYASASFDREGRGRKAKKVLAILEDGLGRLESLTLLDIGCSTGFMCRHYAERFHTVVAVDVDEPALTFAQKSNSADNLMYLAMDSQKLAFTDASFDAVTCTHIYEHVPDPAALMREIHRVLKPNGVCFFSAGNRLSLMEPHYRLPLLSILPKWLAHIYLRLMQRGNFYYETHLTYWGLRKLVSHFELIDYTIKVVREPLRFSAEDMIAPGSIKQKIILATLAVFYWICPTYLWVLRRSQAQKK